MILFLVKKRMRVRGETPYLKTKLYWLIKFFYMKKLHISILYYL